MLEANTLHMREVVRHWIGGRERVLPCSLGLFAVTSFALGLGERWLGEAVALENTTGNCTTELFPSSLPTEP